MKFSYLFMVAVLLGVGWMYFFTVQGPLSLDSNQSVVDLTGKSNDPQSPQKVGEEPQEISGKGPAPELYLKSKSESSPVTTPTPSMAPKSGPDLMSSSGQVNPDAIEHYRKAGLLGASRKALAVLKAQPELWESVEGSEGLRFRQAGGGLTIHFETNDQDAIHGAVVEVDGGGGSARLMTIEMWMTGIEKPWELYWEQQKPGPIAGRIPTKDQQELHYYCDTTAMDPAGALMEPSRCHFLLNMPTPEELAYKKQAGNPTIQPARSRLETY